MIKHIPYQELGKADHGWLRSNHHFSFAHYYNAQRMGFGKLRVVNDDWVAPGTGFPSHPHRNMEIISFVRTGAISHQDSEGNKGITRAGEVQVMSAGTGISHSEYNLSKEALTFYQIWIEPNKLNVNPRWETQVYSLESYEDSLPLLVSGFEEDKCQALFIHQAARIYGGKVSKNKTIKQHINQQAYVLVSHGSVDLIEGNNQVTLQQGDGAEVTDLNNLTIVTNSEAEIIVIDVPA